MPIQRTYKAVIIFSILSGITALPIVVSELHAWEDGSLQNTYAAPDSDHFFIQHPQVEIGLSAKLEEDKKQVQDTETTTTEYEFRESMTISTKGWVYHPDLMTFRLAFTPQWQQESFRRSQSPSLSTESDQSENATIMAFDTGATLFNEKPLSVDLFASRKAEQIDFSNIRDSDIDSQRWGARLNYASPILPTSLSFTHHRSDQSGFYRSIEDRNEARLTLQHLAARSVTRLSLVHDHADGTTYTALGDSDVRIRATSAELTNAFFITDEPGPKLDSRLYGIRSEYNALDYDTRQISENLYWPHTKNLQTRYFATYSDRRFDDSDQTETCLGAGLTHLFRDRLTTTFNTSATMSDFSDSGENLYHSDLGLRYRHPFPWGSIEFGAAYDYSVTNRRGGQNIIPTELRLTLSTGTDSYLNHDNIITDSIMITDISGTVMYTLNIDYTIETLGTDVRISRTLTGAIADGQQVMARYNYRLDAGFDDSRFGQSYQIHLNLWSFLFLTYNHDRLDQSIESGRAPYDSRKDVINTIRLGLVSKWSETRLLYQKQDRNNGNSMDTRSLEQLFNFRPVQNLFVNVTGGVGTRTYIESDVDEHFYSLGTSIGWTPKWWCHLSLNGIRNSTYNSGKEALDYQIAAKVRLTYGLWTASVVYRLRDQNDPGMDYGLWRQEALVTLSRRLW